MLVSPGTRLGPYQIESALGSGGMGEVFVARDTRLHRAVAIKVLKSSLSDEGLGAARFEREARAIAALNHPNICAIHDVGMDEGHRFLVMELLEGETLERQLSTGRPLDVPAILEHGVALADALAAAHAKGLIHRDLKPSNVFVTSRGPMKLLDFGLAKAVESSDATTHAVDEHVTDAGIVPGTIAYMSPEQLRGLSLDSRTDVFSFGLVFYEMATGRRAFGGSTGHLVAAAILGDEPTKPHHVRSEIPQALEAIILKAIEKDRDFRYQSAAELRADLKRLQREMGTRPPGESDHNVREASAGTAGILPPSGSPSSDTQVAVALLRRHWLATAATTLLVVGALVGVPLVVGHFRGAPRSHSESFPDVAVRPVTFSGDISSPAISPDGKFVAFVRQQGIWVRQLAVEPSRKDVLIVPPAASGNYQHLTFTPDGNAVDYLAGDSGAYSLWRVPLLGGTPSVVERDVASAVGWAPDGGRFAFVRTKGIVEDASIVIADRDGSHERVLITRKQPKGFFSVFYPGGPVNRPSWSADGTTLAVAGMDGRPEVVLLDTATGAQRRTVKAKAGLTLIQAAWLDATHILTGVDGPTGSGGLVSLNLSTETWVPVTRDLATLRNFDLAASHATAVAIRTERRMGLWLASGTGGDIRTLFDVNAEGIDAPRVDDSGAVWYAAGASPTDFANGRSSLYRIAPGTSDPSLVVANLGANGYDKTHDGGTLVFTTDHHALVRMNADGSGRVTLLDNHAFVPAITPDGQTVLFTLSGRGLFSVPLQGGTPRKLSDRWVLWHPYVSPTGQRVAFISDKSSIVTVCEMPNCSDPIEFDIPTGSLTRGFGWSPDGSAVVYSPDTDRQNLWARPLDGSAPHQLTTFEKTAPSIWEFAWSRDGRYLVLSRGNYYDDLVLINGLH